MRRGMTNEDRREVRALILGATGLASIEDVLDFAIPGALPPPDDPEAVPPRLCDLAPLVFEAARQGDIVARRILEDTGRALGRQAVAAAQNKKVFVDVV